MSDRGRARIRRPGPAVCRTSASPAVESRAATCGPHLPAAVRRPTARNHGGGPSLGSSAAAAATTAAARLLARSLARPLARLAHSPRHDGRRQEPGPAASVSRCRAGHDDAPGTHVGRLHDHDTPSVIGITAASTAHVHCVPWKFERAPSAMFGETLAGPLRGSNAPPWNGTAKRLGT